MVRALIARSVSLPTRFVLRSAPTTRLVALSARTYGTVSSSESDPRATTRRAGFALSASSCAATSVANTAEASDTESVIAGEACAACPPTFTPSPAGTGATNGRRTPSAPVRVTRAFRGARTLTRSSSCGLAHQPGPGTTEPLSTRSTPAAGNARRAGYRMTTERRTVSAPRITSRS